MKVSIGLLVVFFGYIFFFENFSSLMTFSGRLPAWHEAAWKMFKVHPFIGCGLGLYKIAAISVMHQKQWFAQLHNEYLQVAIELGVIGFFIVFGFVCNMIKIALVRGRYILLLAFMAACINALIHFNMHTVVAWIILLICAMIESERRDKNGLQCRNL